MKKLIFLALISVLAGCASTDNTGSSSNDAEYAMPEELPSAENAPSKTVAKPITPSAVIAATSKTVEESESELDSALKSQQDERIRKAATDALLKNPKDIKAMNALAMSYYRASQFTAALFLLNKAQNINERSTVVLNNMGVVYLAQGETRAAIKAFKKVLEIDSSHALAAANLGQIYVARRAYDKAVTAYEIATSRGIRDWKTMNNYAIALTGTANFAKANDVYRDLMKSKGSEREVLFNYSILLIDHMSKYDEGLELIRKLQFIGPPGESRRKVAELEQKAKTATGK
ncbi:MAG: tetratricopeptide repeat protein [Bdellovibrionota bacterium]